MSLTKNQISVKVRFATIEEAPEIATVLREAFDEYEALYTAEAFAITTPTVHQIESRWAEGPVWVALQNDTIVGTVSAVPRDGRLYIRSMAIVPCARGSGVGTLLLQHVEQFARSQGFKRMFLSTTPFLTRAIKLYDQCGFRRNGEGPAELSGTPLFTMEKFL